MKLTNFQKRTARFCAIMLIWTTVSTSLTASAAQADIQRKQDAQGRTTEITETNADGSVRTTTYDYHAGSDVVKETVSTTKHPDGSTDVRTEKRDERNRETETSNESFDNLGARKDIPPSVRTTTEYDGPRDRDGRTQNWRWDKKARGWVMGLVPSAKALDLRREGDLLVAALQTPHGNLRVNLPGEIMEGETWSGTVEEQPDGKNEEEILKNAELLTGYVVSVESEDKRADARPSDYGLREIGTSLLAGLASRHLLQLVVRDPSGKEAARLPLPTSPVERIPSIPVEEMVPPMAQAGQPVAIRGDYDGKFENTLATIGDKPARILAESGRRLYVRTPRTVVGPATVRVHEGSVVREASMNNVRLSLGAGAKSLRPGQSTDLTVQVEGLAGLPASAYPVQVEIANMSPASVRLSGGPRVKMPVTANMVDSSGKANVKTAVQAVKAGAFAITARMVR